MDYSKLYKILDYIEENLKTKDRLVIIHGAPNLGKSCLAKVLSELYGPCAQIDEEQLGRDMLCFDTAAECNAECLWSEEFAFTHDYGRAFKRILCGQTVEVRTHKNRGFNVNRHIRIRVWFITTNTNPNSVGWLKEAGVMARLLSIEATSKILGYDDIDDWIRAGYGYLQRKNK